MSTLPPLTHHEIVRLVEPFARAGFQVDLAASDRPARRIAFRPRERVIEAEGLQPALALRETLELDARAEGRFVLQRRLEPLDGPVGVPHAAGAAGTPGAPGMHPAAGESPAALLLASGPEPALLLARIEAVPPAQHVSRGAGWRVLRSYDTTLPSGVRVDGKAGQTPLMLTRAQLQAGALTLGLLIKLPGLRSVAADLTLGAARGDAPDLPEDLLAVLGWDWARLVRTREGWTSKLRLRGHVLRRSRTAEAALDRAGAHLARVLAEPPAAFHDRHRLARWGVVLRRGIPTLTVLFMVVGALLLPRFTDPDDTGLWMALHYVPIGLLALSFSLQELSQFEIPPWPRRPRSASWDAPPGPAAGGGSRA